MKSKISIFLAAVCLSVAAFAPARSQSDSATPKTTAGAQAYISASAQGRLPALPSRPPHATTTVPTTDEGGGYWVYPSFANGLASVSATFTLPSFTCQYHGDQEWLLPGIWVFSSGSLTQQVDVNLNCNQGTILMAGFACTTEACGNQLTVSPGDQMVATLAETPQGVFVQLRDLTTGQVTSASAAASTADDVVLVGDVGPDWFFGGVVKRVPTFSSVPFSKVQVNGYYLSDSPFPTRYNLKTTSSVQIKTSAIEGDGDHFVTTFNHN